MDVRIRNFEIPKNCACCPLNFPAKEHNICYAAGNALPDSLSADDNERPDWCPIEEDIRCRSCSSFKPFDSTKGYGECQKSSTNVAVRGDDFCSNAKKSDKGSNCIKVTEDWMLYAAEKSESGLIEE